MEQTKRRHLKIEDTSGYLENFEINLTESGEEGKIIFLSRGTVQTKNPLHVQVKYEENTIIPTIQHRRVLSASALSDIWNKIPDEENDAIEPPECQSFVELLPSSPDNNGLTTTVFQLPAALSVSEASSSCDDSSVGSAGYFEPSDFDASNWKRALNDASALGLAFVALAAAIVHPLLFIAGAVATLGTATAAHRGYDYYYTNEDDSPSWRYWLNFDSNFFGNKKGEDEGLPKANKNSPDQMKTTRKSDELTAERNISVGTLGDGTPVALHSASVESPSKPSRRQSSKATLSKADQQHWLERCYPHLKNTVVKCGGAFVGLNTIEFFHVFFDDDAPYNFKLFQEKRGDIGIQYGSWEQLPTVGAVSMFPSASEIVLNFPPDFLYHSFQRRTLTCKSKTNAFFGPPYANTTKTQRCLIVNRRLAVVESKTVLSEIPFSDRFYVMERWIITADKVENRYIAHVTASCDVIFTESCPFEQQIKTKSTSTITDIVTSWCKMATEAIKLTEKAKLNRLQRTLGEDDDDETDFENDHVDSAKANLAAGNDAEASPAAGKNLDTTHQGKNERGCSEGGVEVVACVSKEDAAGTDGKNCIGEEYFVLASPPQCRQLLLPSQSHQLVLPSRQSRRSFFGKRRCASFDDNLTAQVSI